MSKLYCSFCKEEELDKVVDHIQNWYVLTKAFFFVLYLPQTNEFAITYNLDYNNVSFLLPRTIIVHRKQETGTLYTINAINRIMTLEGYFEKERQKIDWTKYRNCILFTEGTQLKKLSTKLYKKVLKR